LVIHESTQGESVCELFDLDADPAEKTNLITQDPETGANLNRELRDWQSSVLQSLLGKDYGKEAP
jgi:hypothetical protein